MGSDSAALPSLSILPRWKNERCGRRTVGVMGKRSDGDKKKRRKNTGNGLGMIAKEAGM